MKKPTSEAIFILSYKFLMLVHWPLETTSICPYSPPNCLDIRIGRPYHPSFISFDSCNNPIACLAHPEVIEHCLEFTMQSTFYHSSHLPDSIFSWVPLPLCSHPYIQLDPISFSDSCFLFFRTLTHSPNPISQSYTIHYNFNVCALNYSITINHSLM